MGQATAAEATELYMDRRGEGPEVLLIAGLSDPAEAWDAQLEGLADRYRLTAYDNRGAGRTPLPEEPLSIESMADDAVAVLDSLEVPAAHVTGFSGGSRIAQELALRLPEIVAPTLVLAGELDVTTPPRYGRAVADAIPGARFEVLPGEAHQPFQEVPDLFNARVDAFWREIEESS